MGGKRQDTGIFEGEIQDRAFAVLLLVSVPDEIGKTGLIEQVFYRMGAVTSILYQLRVYEFHFA